MCSINYIEIDYNDIEYLIDGNLILIVTATNIETTATHQKLKPLKGYEEILRVYEGDLTYYFGMFGNYKIAHVQCSMGSLSRSSSIMTVSTALDKLKSKIVIMVGIAFGVNSSKQNIGDVLISESIIPYESKRVGIERTIPRGIESPSSKILLNRFTNIMPWEYLLSDGVKAKLITTRLLSGEELIDNTQRRDELTSMYPECKGGEMEGAGVFAACDGKAEWIVIKGICDFADGNKNIDKDKKQIIAVDSALSVCMKVFSSFSAFKKLEVHPYLSEDHDISIKDTNINNVLFDIYDINKEQFYINRSEDVKFNRIVSQFDVWVHGPTGCGKSNMIIRDLIKENRTFIQVNLISYIGIDIGAFFKEILYEIASKVEGFVSQIEPKNFHECSKAIISILQKYYSERELTILIEEIPICSEDDYREFLGKIFSLLISKNSIEGLNKIKFVLSSINNPFNYIPSFQHKIHQQLNVMPLNYWNNTEVNSLINLIENETKIKLPILIRNELVEIANGSPRFIKKFFRSIHSLNANDGMTLQSILKDTQRDLNQY